MKTTKFLTICAAAIALAACSRDGSTPESNSYPVAANFSASINNSSTRTTPGTGEATLWKKGDAIGITAAPKTVNEGTTSYTNIEYTAKADDSGTGSAFTVANTTDSIFFQDNYPVTFTAYYPYSGTDKNAPGTAGEISNTITADEESTTTTTTNDSPTQSQIDYLWATTTSDAARTGSTDIASRSYQNVAFTFNHMMSEVTLNFKLSNKSFLSTIFPTTSTLSYELTDVILDGTFNTTTGVATATTTGSPTKDLKMPLTPSGTESVSSTIILYPNSQVTGSNATSLTNNYLTLKVTYNGVIYTGILYITDGAAESPATTALLAGKHYTYTITLNATGLDVGNATISNWVPVTASDLNAY